MFVILVYDIHVNRVKKIHRVCSKYLTSIQRSVFEGNITDTDLIKLKGTLMKSIQASEDTICIYELRSLSFASKEMIGKDLHSAHIL